SEGLKKLFRYKNNEHNKKNSTLDIWIIHVSESFFPNSSAFISIFALYIRSIMIIKSSLIQWILIKFKETSFCFKWSGLKINLINTFPVINFRYKTMSRSFRLFCSPTNITGSNWSVNVILTFKEPHRYVISLQVIVHEQLLGVLIHQNLVVYPLSTHLCEWTTNQIFEDHLAKNLKSFLIPTIRIPISLNAVFGTSISEDSGVVSVHLSKGTEGKGFFKFSLGTFFFFLISSSSLVAENPCTFQNPSIRAAKLAKNIRFTCSATLLANSFVKLDSTIFSSEFNALPLLLKK
ncbi:hypothetical protein AGLY_004056, partial [Aphis glycines]